MFKYKLKFRNTSAHANADALSRLLLPVEPVVSQTPPVVLLMHHPSDSPVTASQIQECTRKEPQLAPIIQFVQQGWLAPYFEKRTELLIYEGGVIKLLFPAPVQMPFLLSCMKDIQVLRA